jgi:hypothetical protein
MTYSSAVENSIWLYQEARYKEAYDLITKEADSSDAVPALVLYLRFSFACRAGMSELGMQLFHEAVVDNGFWYSQDYLVDDDLEPLRESVEFKRLASVCAERQQAAQEDSRAQMDLVLPAGDQRSRALMVALHGNQGSIKTTRSNWCGKTLSDCTVAFPQSSHVVATGAYSWVDPRVGAEEVLGHLGPIFKDDLVDPGRFVIGGFSAGGRVALHMLLKGMIRPKGLILLGPWLPDLVSLEALIPRLQGQKVRIYLICGDCDQDCFDTTNKLATLLDRSGLSFRYRVVEGMGHHYPSDFEDYLAEAMSYILEG